MQALLPIIWGWLIHSGARFFSVFAIGLVLIVGPYLAYRHVVNTNYQRGYQQSIKDHPQNVYNGESTIIQTQPAAIYGIKFGSHWGIGLVHEK